MDKRGLRGAGTDNGVLVNGEGGGGEIPGAAAELGGNGILSKTVLTAYSVTVTAAAFVCAVGWWRAAERVEDSSAPAAVRPPILRPGPPGGRGRTGPAAARGPSHGAAPLEAGRDPDSAVEAAGGMGDTSGSPASTVGVAVTPAGPSDPGAPARCPNCGTSVSAGGKATTGTTAVNGANLDTMISVLAGAANLPNRLADIPGVTVADKLRSLLTRIHEAVPPPPEGDPNARQSYANQFNLAQARLSELLSEAQKQDLSATRAALFDLFRAESDPTLARTLGTHLWGLTRTDTERNEFVGLLLSLGTSPVAADRVKALGQAQQIDLPETADLWSRMLLSDPDEQVRAEAAVLPPTSRTDASRSLLLRAAEFDPSSTVRTNAIYTVGYNPTAAEMRTLLGIMRSDRDPEVPQAVLDAVAWSASIRDTEVRDTLLEIARDRSQPQSLRGSAVSALLWGTNGGDGYVQNAEQRRELEALEQAIWDEPEGEVR
ncbi:MAG: HEAT repeat domain-containing protein [Planctomycetes bacterium]|nr:HEAT repeat domain-containing protein [Planctomycetota bacterium]